MSRTASTTYVWQLALAGVGPLLCLVVLTSRERRAVLRPLLPLHNPAGFQKYALSACAGGLVSSLVFGRSELFVLQAHHQVVNAGLFAVATGLASQITIPMDSLMAPLFPTAAGVVVAAPDRAKAALHRALRVSSALGAFTAAVVVPAVWVLIPTMFGARFHDSRSAFIALGLTSCLQSVILPVAAFAMATRNAAAVLRTDLICLAVDAGLALGLVPVIGLSGAVIANAGAQLLSLLLLARVVVRRMDVTAGELARTARLFLVGPIAGGAAIAVADVTSLPVVAGIVVAVAVGLAVIMTTLRLIGSLRIPYADVQAVLDRVPGPLRSVLRTAVAVLRLSAPAV